MSTCPFQSPEERIAELESKSYAWETEALLGRKRIAELELKLASATELARTAEDMACDEIEPVEAECDRLRAEVQNLTFERDRLNALSRDLVGAITLSRACLGSLGLRQYPNLDRGTTEALAKADEILGREAMKLTQLVEWIPVERFRNGNDSPSRHPLGRTPQNPSRMRAMTPEAQRIAIAEFCGLNPYRWCFKYQHEEGWDDSKLYTLEAEAQNDWKLLYDGPTYATEIKKVVVCPDYLNDLNAIQDAWGCLGWEEKNECVEYLKEIVKEADCEACFATATQRAEAVLRTIGKWVE